MVYYLLTTSFIIYTLSLLFCWFVSKVSEEFALLRDFAFIPVVNTVYAVIVAFVILTKL